MGNVMQLTDHAIQRAKNRCGWDTAKLKRIAKKALKQSKHGEEIHIVSKCKLTKHYKCNNPKEFGNFIFIFHDGTLLTVWRKHE